VRDPKERIKDILEAIDHIDVIRRRVDQGSKMKN
jgi:hypothetical protein